MISQCISFGNLFLADGDGDRPPLHPESIPPELTCRRQWVNWNFEDRDYGVTKVPKDPRSRGNASPKDPSTWSTFQDAFDALAEDDYAGLGFIISEDDPYFGFDLDNSVDRATGWLKPWAEEIVNLLETYTEISPSGKGVKGYCRARSSLARWNTGRRYGHEDGAVEVYDRRRFFTVTGLHFPGTPATVNDRQRQVDDLLARFEQGRRDSRPVGGWDGEVWNTGLPDKEVFQIAWEAKNRAKFQRLWQGDATLWTGEGKLYISQSEADMALLTMLAFYTGPDPEQIQRLFSRSSLGKRDKWIDREDYREVTLELVLDRMVGFYGRPAALKTRNGGARHG
jgi:putative DNA primase/helicase